MDGDRIQIDQSDALLQSLMSAAKDHGQEVNIGGNKDKGKSKSAPLLNKALVLKQINELDLAIDAWMTDDPVKDCELYVEYLTRKGAYKVKKGKRVQYFNKNAKLDMLCSSNLYPIALRNLAAVLFNLPVSNATVERVFSQLKLVYSKRRLNMLPRTVSDILFLGVNKLVPTYGLKDLLDKKRLDFVHKAAAAK